MTSNAESVLYEYLEIKYKDIKYTNSRLATIYVGLGGDQKFRNSSVYSVTCNLSLHVLVKMV
jgi:hypothetical protein